MKIIPLRNSRGKVEVTNTHTGEVIYVDTLEDADRYFTEDSQKVGYPYGLADLTFTCFCVK